MWPTIQRLGLLVGLGVAVGVGVNALSPRGIPYLTPPKAVLVPTGTVSFATAEQLWRAGAIFLDARSTADYEAGHVANALNLPAQEFPQHFPKIGAMLSRDVPIIVYCDGEACELSHQLQGRLRAAGFDNVRVLLNGWSIWRSAGLPTTTGAQP